MPDPHVVVVGSINMDYVVRADRLPRRGETVIGGDLERRAGGKGANQAVAVRRLGATSSLVGRVGRDDVGSLLCRSLADDGVNVDAVERADGPTGVALVLIDAAGENMIAVAPGVNGTLDGARLATSGSVLRTADVLLLQLEVPVAAAAAAARVARDSGIPIVLNAAPMPTNVAGDLLELVATADVLVVNQTEATRLTAAVPGLHGEFESRHPATVLRSLGVGEVVVTCGESGAVLLTSGGASKYVPGFAVDAVDTVGAGDAFCAELSVALGAEVSDPALAVERACAAGALATRHSVGQRAFPTRGEVDALLAANGPRTSPVRAGDQYLGHDLTTHQADEVH